MRGGEATATKLNLGHVLKAVGQQMNPEEDVLFLFLTVPHEPGIGDPREAPEPRRARPRRRCRRGAVALSAGRNREHETDAERRQVHDAVRDSAHDELMGSISNGE